VETAAISGILGRMIVAIFVASLVGVIVGEVVGDLVGIAAGMLVSVYGVTVIENDVTFPKQVPSSSSRIANKNVMWFSWFIGRLITSREERVESAALKETDWVKEIVGALVAGLSASASLLVI